MHPSISSLIPTILEDGYIILPSLFPLHVVDSAIRELDRLEQEQGEVGGRNAFEGKRTRRVYALSDKSRVFDAFATDETVGRLNDFFLMGHYC